MTNVRIAAALCFLAVALGAFGAHSLRSTLEAHGMLDVWNKAVLYHFIHAIALFVLALYGTANRGAWWLLFAGIFRRPLFPGRLGVATYRAALVERLSCTGGSAPSGDAKPNRLHCHYLTSSNHAVASSALACIRFLTRSSHVNGHSVSNNNFRES